MDIVLIIYFVHYYVITDTIKMKLHLGIKVIMWLEARNNMNVKTQDHILLYNEPTMILKKNQNTSNILCM